MMKIAQSQGINCQYLGIDELGYNLNDHTLRDVHDEKISTLYTLYPYEFMLEEDHDKTIMMCDSSTIIEPPYKLAMTTKRMLPLLSERYPLSQYLLKAFNTATEAEESLGANYVEKPVLERQGAGIKIVENGNTIAAEQNTAPAGKETDCIYQQLAKLPEFNTSAGEKVYPVLGVWVIGGEVCGMGIREASNLITGNTAKFVPHIFTKTGKMPNCR